MRTRYFAYRGFEVRAFAQRGATGLWISVYEAFAVSGPGAIDLDSVLCGRFVCDGLDHRLALDEDEAIEEAVALARAAIDTREILASWGLRE
ncbi:hypothetical protein [Cupriavidus sp. WS]|uniref:hypothetical protein n=1 Tax=Cupriavidus sp. WS TaxID=1312922 RepID=UPI0003686309|nr:hypothetical protein [Cupriavidus sp. WS]